VRDVLPELMKWWEGGETIGVGTVVTTFRSAPRPPGASMLVCPDDSAVGSVSGGCVEGAVYDLAQAVLESGEPALQRYGVSDDDAFAVGLTCGGILDVYVQMVNQETFPELGEIAEDIDAGRPVALATVIEHPDRSWLDRRLVVRPGQDGTLDVGGTVGSPRADDAVRDDALGLLAAGTSATLTYGIVTVCDARPVFATTSRFPDADDVVVDWPHRYLTSEKEAGRIDPRTIVTVLTHDPKFDVPLLEVALRMPEIGYVGAMGSRRTHQVRMDRLREMGLTEDELGRLYGPIGLDLGARTPEETAISIVAEIIAGRWGGTGRHLRDTFGQIHESADRSLAAL